MNKFNQLGPNSELLRTFCVVAESGNVTQSASKMSRTQSAISVQIKKLEDYFSVELFERQARGMVLSESGRKLLPLAKNALKEVDQIANLFSTPLSGKVRVGIPDDYNDTILEIALAKFCKRHTNVEVFVQSGCTAGFPDAIAKNKLDIAVYSARPVSKKDAFFSEPTVWVCATHFKFDKNDSIPMAIIDRHCWWRNVATNALDESGISWRTAYLSANFASLKASIRSGLAVGVLALSAVEDSMRVLGKKEGFPSLPSSSLQLLKREQTPINIVQEMEAALRQSVETRNDGATKL